MEQLIQRLETLEQHVRILQQQNGSALRRLRWWRRLVLLLALVSLFSLPLPLGEAQQFPVLDQIGRRITALERKLQHVTSVIGPEGLPELVITQANLRIVNGFGITDCTNEQFNRIPGCPNGLGNLIVGYNEPRVEGEGENIRTGSHNVVVGQAHNFSGSGGLVVGLFNTISRDFSAVTGGSGNTASESFASVSGGVANTASGFFASVSGGLGNTASNYYASVSGGVSNKATGNHSSVSGGNFNRASGAFASINGGHLNRATGDGASIGGGADNNATGPNAFVGGGLGNNASGNNSSVSGGGGNTADGPESSVSGGGGNRATGGSASVSGGIDRVAREDFDWAAGGLFQDK